MRDLDSVLALAPTLAGVPEPANVRRARRRLAATLGRGTNGEAVAAARIVLDAALEVGACDGEPG